jgi:hypothetical protein
LNNLRGELNNGQQPTLPAPAEGEPLPPENPTNLVRGAASPLPEEQKPNSQTPESIALESTGGVLPNGGRA